MEKIYVKPFLQQYRDADHEGKIGMRAVVHYFELCASEFMYRNQKGQDTLPEKFGLAWMYTKYKIHLNKKFGFDTPVELITWVERIDRVRLYEGYEVVKDGETLVNGRLESCIFNPETKQLKGLKDVEIDQDFVLGKEVPLDRFKRTNGQVPDAEYVYTHKVRYSDIDSNHHMFNLRYLDLIDNAFTLDFYDEYFMSDLELHFISQAHYGDELDVFKKDNGDGHYEISIRQKDGTTVIYADTVMSRKE